LLEQWGPELAERVGERRASNGCRAAARYGLRSVSEEAAAGFPVLFENTLPTLRAALAEGWPPQQARLQAFFATMAVLEDTNLAHRGGMAGLQFAQGAARDFLAAGGAGAADAERRAEALHRAFVARRLSPGGSADVLAAACCLQRVCA
jgi:triphosphoribosyl-dephospho-CoA synthase